MKIEMSVKECDDIGHVHYLLASGFYTGTAQISSEERIALFEKARFWFERAYIYGGSDASRKLAEFCDEQAKELRPALYAVAS